jgi:hypothetical protein
MLPIFRFIRLVGSCYLALWTDSSAWSHSLFANGLWTMMYY